MKKDKYLLVYLTGHGLTKPVHGMGEIYHDTLEKTLTVRGEDAKTVFNFSNIDFYVEMDLPEEDDVDGL